MTLVKAPLTAAAAQEANLRRIELAVTRRLDGLLHGDHQAFNHGSGFEAGEGRPYQPGDDARRIDWNLTARLNEVHVRDTIAERELETWLVIDTTESLRFGTADWEKRDLAVVAAAAFGLLGARAGNRTGAVTFDATGTRISPPRTGREAVMTVLRQIVRDTTPRDPRDPADSGVTLADAIRRTRGVARRRGRIVVISDLIDSSAWPDELRAAQRRHDVIVAEVTDPRESSLPAVGLLTLVDPETGRRREVQTADPRFRARFAAAAQRQREETAAHVGSARARHLRLSTDRDWMLDLVRFAARPGAARREPIAS
jgi:uncharacterized protein (DUF58 family)